MNSLPVDTAEAWYELGRYAKVSAAAIAALERRVAELESRLDPRLLDGLEGEIARGGR